jgi:hypothetical protein
VACCWLLMLATAIAAQRRPDFSGPWVLEPSLSSDNAPATMTVSPMIQSGPETRMKFEFPSPDGPITETRQVGLFGGNVGAAGASTHYGGSWEGTDLVFDSGTHTGRAPKTGEWKERRERWWLDEAGRLHIVTTTGGSDEPTTTVRWVFARP